mgnify:CR=1 FL=1
MESDRFGEWSLEGLIHAFEDLQNQNFIFSLDNFHWACQIPVTVTSVLL